MATISLIASIAINDRGLPSRLSGFEITSINESPGRRMLFFIQMKHKSLNLIFIVAFLVFLLVAVVGSILNISVNIAFILAFAISGYSIYLNSPEQK